MPSTSTTPSSLRLSLIPWAAFLITLPVADRQTIPLGLLVAAPLYIPFVAFPSWLPLATARHRATTLLALTTMTATAIVAAVMMSASEDAQAGLAVFLVPYVAVPLAAVLWAGEAVATRVLTRGRSTCRGGAHDVR